MSSSQKYSHRNGQCFELIQWVLETCNLLDGNCSKIYWAWFSSSDSKQKRKSHFHSFFHESTNSIRYLPFHILELSEDSCHFESIQCWNIKQKFIKHFLMYYEAVRHWDKGIPFHYWCLLKQVSNESLNFICQFGPFSSSGLKKIFVAFLKCQLKKGVIKLTVKLLFWMAFSLINPLNISWRTPFTSWTVSINSW